MQRRFLKGNRMPEIYIVGVDGSEQSHRAIKYAAARAKAADANLHLALILEWSAFSFHTAEELAERHKRREEELDRAEADEIYSAAVYYSLSDGFLNKLSSDINYAASQIPTSSSNNLIYVIVNFDDFVGLYYKEYEKQIRHHLSQAHESVQVYLRIGLRGKFSIQHRPRNA